MELLALKEAKNSTEKKQMRFLLDLLKVTSEHRSIAALFDEAPESFDDIIVVAKGHLARTEEELREETTRLV